MKTNLQIDWEKMQGLVPVIIQDVTSLQVLMLGYMNEEAFNKTQSEGRVTFYSRSKKRLWTKGESSSHFLEVQKIMTDCDQDSLLILVKPEGPTCHLERKSCFEQSPANFFAFLSQLEWVIENRLIDKNTESYTAKLVEQGIKRVAQKVGEEAVEVALAATSCDYDELINESADLLYHLLVLLAASKVKGETVMAELIARHN